MASVQERLQLKREPIDQWSTREKLCLAAAVARSGDQNWMSVSRNLKSFAEPNRPSDWFFQKNCASQYGMLLSSVETPKRKNKRVEGTPVETPAEFILKKLRAERLAELKKLMAEEKAEYNKLQQDLSLLQSGKVSEEQLDLWCKEIDEEERKKEQEALLHSQWLKEREQRKLEIEKVWRHNKVVISGQKQKSSDSENVESGAEVEEVSTPKPALSPLLTSLLKSPSQVQSATMLHSGISRSQAPVTNTNPMIASLLNSTTNVTVSPTLQQLVSTAIGQNQPPAPPQNINSTISEPQPPQQEQQPQQQQEEQEPITNDILDDPNLPNIKLDDLANSILVQDGPLPEIKKEEVDDIISEIIESAQDIVDCPEEHFQLDNNGELELEAFGEEEEETGEENVVIEEKTEERIEEKSDKKPDPFEFEEDPIVFDPMTKPSGQIVKQDPNYVPHYQQISLNDVKDIKDAKDEKEDDMEPIKVEIEEEPEKSEPKTEEKSEEEIPPTVEIVQEVEEEEEEEVVEPKVEELEKIESEDNKSKVNEETEESSMSESKDVNEESEETLDSIAENVIKQEKENERINLDVAENVENSQDFSDNEINMELKIEKASGVKRDYSRLRKKEEKDFDMLLAIEKAAQLEDSELTEETFSDATTDTEKKETKPTKIKQETDRSNSPWTEEEDNIRGNKRRYSTPATPEDSIANSPASTNTFCEDDSREYKNWKKSVMLVYNRLATNKYASLFLKPITEDQAPGYNSLIYRPMDLQTIKKNIENGTIRTTLEFKRDVMLMFTNAIMYNKTDDTVYTMAVKMQQESLQPIEILMQAQQGDAPLRRETRTSESGVKRKRTVTDELGVGKGKRRKED